MKVMQGAAEGIQIKKQLMQNKNNIKKKEEGGWERTEFMVRWDPQLYRNL